MVLFEDGGVFIFGEEAYFVIFHNEVFFNYARGAFHNKDSITFIVFDVVVFDERGAGRDDDSVLGLEFKF